jgi:hypothetical protein
MRKFSTPGVNPTALWRVGKRGVTGIGAIAAEYREYHVNTAN